MLFTSSRPKLLVCVGSLFVGPALGQFGLAGKKKRGTSFQEINEQAQEEFGDGDGGMAGFDMDALGNLANMGGMGDMGDIGKMISDAMQDPEMMKLMSEMNSQVGGAMEQLANLSPEELEQQMQAAMSLFSNGDLMEEIMGNQEEVLKNLEASGMVDAETLQEFKDNPQKLESDMKEAFSQMQEAFTDPEAVKAASDIAVQLVDVMKNPEKIMDSFSQMAEIFEKELSDDGKIEDARMQLLENPALAGSEELASVFGTEEMKNILNDPIKWRESVKKGQGMLLAGQGAADM